MWKGLKGSLNILSLGSGAVWKGPKGSSKYRVFLSLRKTRSQGMKVPKEQTGTPEEITRNFPFPENFSFPREWMLLGNKRELPRNYLHPNIHGLYWIECSHMLLIIIFHLYYIYIYIYIYVIIIHIFSFRFFFVNICIIYSHIQKNQFRQLFFLQIKK